jgi:hypothetical protein
MKNLWILVTGVKPELAKMMPVSYARLCLEDFPCYAQFVDFENCIMRLPKGHRITLKFLKIELVNH